MRDIKNISSIVSAAMKSDELVALIIQLSSL